MTGILDSTGAIVTLYDYDAWGNILAITDGSGTDISQNADHIGNINPLRYRGYQYDAESGLYYVMSRYYDAVVGRFINADNVISGTGESVEGYNLYAYCLNNPVNMSDTSGNWPKWAKKIVAAVAVVAVVAVVAAVTVATAGTGSAIAAVAVGMAKGAVIGFAVGAIGGAAKGYATTRTAEGTLNGMADGALKGTVSGAISGGFARGLRSNSGTSTGKGFTSFKQLKKEVGSAGAGNEWHHIVEQSQITKSGFSAQMVQNTNNIVAIEKKHTPSN